jgi:hypothetical protein
LNNAYCTIITADYLPYAQALLDSLSAHTGGSAILYVLVADEQSASAHTADAQTPQLRLVYPDQIPSEMARSMAARYQTDYMDGYRWAMKPVFMAYLMQEMGLDRVLYLDSDLFFFSDPRFLFDLLDGHRVILTPHWRCAERPEDDPSHFRTNFLDGIYNAGFVGARRDALDILHFWANLCRYACTIRQQDGYYVDQKYLDILHSRFEGVGVVRHRGCNVSDWNRDDCRRTLLDSGTVAINGTYPIVFIHFTKDQMARIVEGADPLLRPHLDQYAQCLGRYHPDINLHRTAQQYLQFRLDEANRLECRRRHPTERLKRFLLRMLHPTL